MTYVSLDQPENAIGPKGAVALSPALKELTGLTNLWLSGNSVVGCGACVTGFGVVVVGVRLVTKGCCSVLAGVCRYGWLSRSPHSAQQRPILRHMYPPTYPHASTCIYTHASVARPHTHSYKHPHTRTATNVQAPIGSRTKTQKDNLTVNTHPPPTLKYLPPALQRTERVLKALPPCLPP